MKKITVLVVLSLLLSLFSAAAVSAAGPAGAKVVVVHGIPGPDGLPVDISVGDTCAVQGLVFAKIATPPAVPAGTYDVAVRPANPSTPCGSDPLVNASLTFEDGKLYSVVAHLTEAAAPTVTMFQEDTAGLKTSRGRFIVHHTAAAPAVDFMLKRGTSAKSIKKLEGLTNGMTATMDGLPGNWRVSLFAAGTTTPALKTAKLQLKPRMVSLVYAVGSQADGNLTVITKRVSIPKARR